jgi:hypothetical protein
MCCATAATNLNLNNGFGTESRTGCGQENFAMATTVSKLGSEILVNTATAGSQSDQQITALSNGGFVVTWQDDSQGVGGTTGAPMTWP